MIIRTLITRALKKLKVLAAGENPSDGETQDCLQYVLDYYKSACAFGVNGAKIDKYIEADYTASDENERLTLANDTIVITLPNYITISNDTKRPIKDGAMTVVNVIGQGIKNIYIYDAHLAKWIDINALTLDSDALYSERLGNGLVALIARLIADEFGVELTQSIISESIEFENALAREFVPDMTGQTDIALAWPLVGRNSIVAYS